MGGVNSGMGRKVCRRGRGAGRASQECMIKLVLNQEAFPCASPLTAKVLSDLISRGFSGRFLLFLQT